MATRIKYVLWFIGLFLTSHFAVAQYGEEDLIEEADGLFESGQYAEAMPLFSQLLSLNPTNPVFNYKYGATALYGDAEKKEEAIKYLKFAVGKPNVDHSAYYFLGRAYHLNYLFQDAVNAYEKYKSDASGRDIEDRQVNLKIEMARNGQALLSNIKEIKVLDKKTSPEESFFRIYDLSDIGGKILVTPEELLSSEDEKRNHRSLIHFRGTGTTVYFSSYGKNGKNGLDIYRADVLPDGTFTDPTPIEGPINTPYDENYPFLHPDDETFYFSSKGHGSMGGYDVFKAAFDKRTGTFSRPVNLDFAINTPDDDLFYLADSLNEMAHFASARSSKQGELNVYKVLVKSAPLDITFIKGTFANKVNTDQKLAKITVIDASTNREVDVQYSDPNTGDYVLNFDKGGRYKFLVEVKNGTKVHAGLVDIPSSKGANAYLQEMELIESAGVEKLVINNLFDQTYEGDIMALAQRLLRQRAALDVNFDPETDPAPVQDEEVEKDPALAYNDAGFGAGMSNEAILEQAEARVEELLDRKVMAEQLRNGAVEASNTYNDIAETEQNRADSLLEATESLEGNELNRTMFLASIAKLRAKNALRKAKNSEVLSNELSELTEEREKIYTAEKQRIDSMQNAIDSGDYDEIYASLVREQEVRKNVDKVEDRFDPLIEFRESGLKAEEEAQKLLDRAQSIREREENLQARLITKRRQAEQAKGKDKEALEEDVAVIESDLKSLQRQAERAFGQAEDAQEKAYDDVQRYEILAEVESREYMEAMPEKPLTIAWTKESASSISDRLKDLPIDNEKVREYIASHPEALADLEEQGMSMQFKRAFIAEEEEPLLASAEGSSENENGRSSEATEQLGQEGATNLDNRSGGENDLGGQMEEIANNEETESTAVTDFTDESDMDIESDRSTDTIAEPSGANENETLADADQSQSGDSVDGEGKSSENSIAVAQGSTELAEEDKVTSDEIALESPSDFESSESDDQNASEGDLARSISEIETSTETEMAGDLIAEEDYTDDYDANLPPEKRIEAEELKVKAASDWIAIIDESIAELESGMGGEEGAEEQLESYRELKTKKQIEIEQRQANIDKWRAEMESPVAIDRALADIDTLSPSYIARLEAKMEDYSTEIASIKTVSSINRDYLPSLAEIELSGKSEIEIAQERIDLNENLIRDLDNILTEGISSDLTEEEVLEIRRVKMLELEQDREVMQGSSEYIPRTAEAREYRDLVAVNEEASSSEDEEKKPEQNELSPKLSPAVASSLESDYSKDLILPEFEESLQEANLTSNEEMALTRKIELRQKFLENLQSEIALFKTVVESNENPDPKVVERYNILLGERSTEAEQLEEDRARLAGLAEIEEVAVADISDNLRTEFESEIQTIPAEDKERRAAIADSALAKTGREMDALMALLDNPESEVDRDQLQAEIQELQSFQAEVQTEIAEANEPELLSEIQAEPKTFESEPELADNVAKIDSEDQVNESESFETEEITMEDSGSVSDEAIEAESPAAETLDEDRPDLTSIATLTENLQVEFSEASKELETDLNSEADRLDKMSELNSSYTEIINRKIDSLRSIDQNSIPEEDRELLTDEIAELEALSADKQQEIDRLESEKELLSVEVEQAPADDPIQPTNAEEGVEISELTDIREIQYKSLNASIIRSGLKEKADSVSVLQTALSQAEDAETKSGIKAEIERLSSEINTGIRGSNLAEIEYYRSENERLLGMTDPNNSVNKDKIIELQEEQRSIVETVEGDARELTAAEQFEIIKDLSEINRELDELTVVSAKEASVDASSSFNRELLSPESHEKPRGNTYRTAMQAKVEKELSANEREVLIASDPALEVRLDFAGAKDVEEKKQLIKTNTKVDEIGLELLGETPMQLNYLATAIKADSLKTLEKRSSKYATELQAQAIESSSEAERLMKMIPNQDSQKEKEIVKNRAEKLMAEAEVLYQKSAIAAGQAEFLRAKRMENEQELTSISADLSSKQVRALNDLLLKPGYNVVSAVPEIAEAEQITAVSVPELVEKVKTDGEEEFPEGAETDLASSETPDELRDIKGNWLSMVEVIAEKDDFSDVEETMFAEAENTVYSDKTPIPLDPAMPDGLIFQVQVGAYRNPIPQDLFGAYAPIMGQQLDNGIVRYRAGLFQKYRQAMLARDDIRSKGYSDAFVVAYVDGERLTGAQARSILDQAREQAATEMQELAEATTAKPEVSREPEITQPESDYYNDPEAAEAEQVEVMKGLFYTVQVGVYSKPVKLGQLFNLTELNSELTSSGYIRYTTGRFIDLQAATERKKVARTKGVGDAFITAYYNGKRISLDEASEILDREGEEVLLGNEKSSTIESEASNETYVVIMGSFQGEVPQELADIFLEKRNWGIRKVDSGTGAAMYLSKELDDLREARELLEQCQALGISTAVIGVMVDGEIVSTKVK